MSVTETTAEWRGEIHQRVLEAVSNALVSVSDTCRFRFYEGKVVATAADPSQNASLRAVLDDNALDVAEEANLQLQTNTQRLNRIAKNTPSEIVPIRIEHGESESIVTIGPYQYVESRLGETTIEGLPDDDGRSDALFEINSRTLQRYIDTLPSEATTVQIGCDTQRIYIHSGSPSGNGVNIQIGHGDVEYSRCSSQSESQVGLKSLRKFVNHIDYETVLSIGINNGGPLSIAHSIPTRTDTHRLNNGRITFQQGHS